jgi:hypothetical protein
MCTIVVQRIDVMSKAQLLILVAFLIGVSNGCHNRSANQWGNGFYAGGSTIAAPPTGSLSIPSLAKNPPYYIPGQTVPGQTGPAGISATLTPNTSAPRPSNYPAAINPAANQLNSGNLNGWQPTNGNNGASTNSGQSVLSSPTIFASNGATPTGFRATSATAMPGTGSSFTDSRNYQTTQVDERLDQTRLPATDASNVRAPARNYPTGDVSRLAQLPPPNNPRYPSTFNSTASVGQPVYLANPIVGSGPVYAGQPMVVGSQSYQANPTFGPTPSVLAQSTTTYDPYNGGSQLGWRDREIGSGSYQR